MSALRKPYEAKIAPYVVNHNPTSSGNNAKLQ